MEKLFVCALACFVLPVLPSRAAFDVYFLRHGQTDWNLERRLQGSVSYTKLTDEGRRMAEKTGEGMAAAGLRFDRVYTSPYARARDTAELVARKTGPEPKVDSRLREMCFGKYEGQKYGKGDYPDENLRIFFEGDADRYVPQGEGAESFAQVQSRLRDFLEKELRPQDGKVTNVLCVAHSLVLKSLVRELAGNDAPASARKTLQPNCCVHVVRYDNGRFSLVETGKTYLGTVEQNFDFRKRLLEVHVPRLTADAAPVASDETEVDASWTVVALSDDPTVRHAAADLQDYFRKSLRVRVGTGCEPGARTISVGVAAETNALTARIAVSANRIRITGATAREAFQGVTRLEDELNARGRPCAKQGVRTYTRMFSPRMTHSGYEVETFPDAYLDRLAHAGMDAILVFIDDPPDVTRNGRVDMPALVKRAAERGIDVWAYADFPRKAAKLHPLDPGAREWYDATYGAIVRNAPGLKGLICVGEVCAFPSREPGMGGFWWQNDWEKNKKLNGLWPVLDWVEWLDLVKSVTRQYKPDFDVVFWTYNWFKKPAELRLPLLEKIPTDLTLLVTYVRGDKPVEKCGVPWFVTDYSISVPGPSAVFRSEADVAVRRGIPVMTISNTGGRTWDSGVAPYVPAPWRWKARFDSLRDAQKRWGVKALMESHHYGFQPNFIAELAKAELTVEADPADFPKRLEAIAVREFGAALAPAALAAWKDWSEAMTWHQVGDNDFWGPLRVGPVYPLVDAGKKLPPPLHPYGGYSDGAAKGTGWRYMKAVFDLDPKVVDGELEMAEKEMALWSRGVDTLKAALPSVPAEKADGARRILGVGEFFLRSVRTLANVKRYYRAGLKGDRDEQARIRADERENVLATIPLVEFDSSLGWEPTMGYVCDKANLEWKLNQLKGAK